MNKRKKWGGGGLNRRKLIDEFNEVNRIFWTTDAGTV